MGYVNRHTGGLESISIRLRKCVMVNRHTGGLEIYIVARVGFH